MDSWITHFLILLVVCGQLWWHVFCNKCVVEYGCRFDIYLKIRTNAFRLKITLMIYILDQTRKPFSKKHTIYVPHLLPKHFLWIKNIPVLDWGELSKEIKCQKTCPKLPVMYNMLLVEKSNSLIEIIQICLKIYLYTII